MGGGGSKSGFVCVRTSRPDDGSARESRRHGAVWRQDRFVTTIRHSAIRIAMDRIKKRLSRLLPGGIQPRQNSSFRNGERGIIRMLIVSRAI